MTILDKVRLADVGNEEAAVAPHMRADRGHESRAQGLPRSGRRTVWERVRVDMMQPVLDFRSAVCLLCQPAQPTSRHVNSAWDEPAVRRLNFS